MPRRSPFVMKRVGGCLGLLLCALPRHALAQTPDTSGATSESPAPPPSPDMSAAPQSAEDPADAPRAVPTRLSSFHPQERVWYGWQTLISDGVSLSVTTVGLTLFVNGAGAPDEGIAPSPWFTVGGALAVIGAAGYVLAPLAIHSSHDRTAAAFGGAGLRLLLPLLGAEIGGRVSCGSRSFCAASPGQAVGFIAGVVAASAIDAGLLAWDDARPAPPDTARATFGVAPLLSADRRQAGLRVFGTF